MRSLSVVDLCECVSKCPECFYVQKYAGMEGELSHCRVMSSSYLQLVVNVHVYGSAAA